MHSPKTLFFINVIIPIMVAPIYFVLARYIKKVKPLRLLIMGEQTYNYAFLIFLFFGIFFIGRPFQILLGQYPAPLIVSSIREFIMIGLLAPCVFAGVLNQVYYDSEFPKITIRIAFVFCILLGLTFVYANYHSINGSKFLFEYQFLGMKFRAYDGNWFSSTNANLQYLMPLFLTRLISPVLILTFTGVLAIYKAITFPKDSLYNNLPKKFLLEGIAILIFCLTVVLTGVMAYFWNFQTQWYYFGALIAGILGYISLKIPPRSFVVTNALQENK